MKRISYLTILGLLLSGGIYAQVTIGSGQAPAGGALLDLKEEGTTTKGMMLPRVKLADVAKLKMGTNEILDADNGGDQYKKHTGLWVYNISDAPLPKCAPIPDGLYVWDGAKWNGINITKAAPAALDVGTQATFYLPSGRDARSLAAQNFTATWQSNGGTVAYTNAASAGMTAVPFSGANALPASGSLTSSPRAFSLLPDAMTLAEITANPFRTKESTLAFNAMDECSVIVDKTITLHQTNKAFTMATTSYNTPTSGTYNNTINSNTKWQLASMVPSGVTSAFTGIQLNNATLTIGAVTDWEQNNNAGQGTANNLTYTITTGAAKSRYSKLTFSDTENPKRFADVILSVLQCSKVGINPTMSEWADIAGFAYVAELKISDADDIAKGIDKANTTTGIAWHRDQDGNVFLSSSFHPTNITGDVDRWMITNLAATSFVPDADRTGADNRVLQDFGASPSGSDNYKTPLWGYSYGGANAATATTFTNNPRLGRLYNWAAATNSRGNIDTGKESITDGENVNITRPIIQGICPKGWHLPSDVEWTALEREFSSRTTLYSSATGNANGTIVEGGEGWRGLADNANSHANAMKEQCEENTFDYSKGTSNPIGTVKRPGFETLLAGLAYGGLAYGDREANLWSASGNETELAWIRFFDRGYSQVRRATYGRINLFSVRCKK